MNGLYWIHGYMNVEKEIRAGKRYLKNLGPGITTGAADDDPSGIATYSQSGAQFGFQFLFTSLITFPLMAVVQEMCARIGLATGEGLAANIRRHYPAWILYLCAGLLFTVNSFNIGADLGMMAEATRLVLPGISFWLLVGGFAAVSLLLQIFTSYGQYAKYLKYLTLFLLAYVATAFLVSIDWRSALFHTFIPTFHFTKDELFILAAILGTTISPYLFFWQTSQEVEEEILRGKRTLQERRSAVSPRSLSRMRIDVWSGMFFSNIVMFFIMAVTAATLGGRDLFPIETAADAALALRPLAGDAAYLLFALGIIGTGMLAVPVLAGSASYAISESFRLKEGLYRTFKQAHAFYGIIIASVAVGFVTSFIGIDPVRALLYAAIGNALIAPVILFLVLRLSGDTKVMGAHANAPLARVVGWGTALLMTVVSVATVISFF